MRATELIDRLISDVEKSIEIRNVTPSVETQIRLTPLGHNDLSQFVSALNVGTLDSHVDIVTQFINNDLFSHKHGEKLNIELFLNELITNKEAIVERVEYILDDNLVSTTMESPSDMLIEQFDWIHEYAR